MSEPNASCHSVAIIGSGFSGIGMAVALKRQGVHDFVLLERSGDVGGVWRDNTYPGAGCDVPSHLYSFSFAPNPDWTRVFSSQSEIHAYLRDCAARYDLHRHVRLHAEVTSAEWDEAGSRWRVRLMSGEVVEARILVSGTGQLSRPIVPRIAGADALTVPHFHSAHWDHSEDVSGRSVAVIGTGASAIQFVPQIAKTARKVTVFQRSAPYVIKRPDRAYHRLERAAFRRWPALMKLLRGKIFLQLETRTIAFTRFPFLLDLAAGIPSWWHLRRQVRDKALRQRLTPDYRIGCKRILISNEYYATMAEPNVELVTEAVTRFCGSAVETADGRSHPADLVVYGTGFAATEFLSPMRITGRDGLELNRAWRDGASAYLGLSVPGFPNFFVLYGPNTNLGHSSIVYMLESQIGHVLRVRGEMARRDTDRAEIRDSVHAGFTDHIRRRLTGTAWADCTSWYVDEAGRNSTNWPGYTVVYRWLTRHASIDAYRFTRRTAQAGEASTSDGTTRDGTGVFSVPAPRDAFERANAAFLRLFLRVAFRPFIGPPLPARAQRGLVRVLALLMPPAMPSVLPPRASDVLRRPVPVEGAACELVVARKRRRDPHPAGTRGAVLYLHGGAFCLGGPNSHRSVTTRLARASGCPVWVPDYRLAPEHPFPAALDDVLSCYDSMLSAGISADRIVVCGDSAGGSLALALAITLRDRGDRRLPAGLALISPVTDPGLTGPTLASHRSRDPMIRESWLRQGIGWYASQRSRLHRPLDADLAGLPPMLLQVGDEEILLSDTLRLAERARQGGVDCRVEIHHDRWHVFHLQSFYLRSGRLAIDEIAAFARKRVGGTEPHRPGEFRSRPAPDPRLRVTPG